MRRSLLVAALGATLAAQTPHSSFESPQTHALDVSADGLRMVVVNTPDAHLAYYSLSDPLRPVLLREIPVGAEPVAVHLRTAREAWVVCHLADAVQVVDLEAGVVLETLHLGDDPGDLAFAGGKAYVSMASDSRLAVIDPVTRQRVAWIDLPCEEPRYMLASADGSRVWVASHRSGNRTTLVPEGAAPAQPAPTNTRLPDPPRASLIVDAEDPAWRSAHGRSLSDWDVFEVDAQHGHVTERFEGVGTILFGMAERTRDQSVWVTNTEARNLVRFEPELRGHVVDNRLTRIDRSDDPDHVVRPIDLHPGLDYDTLPNPAARATSLAQPTDAVWSLDEEVLYVAAFGTDRIGLVDPQGRRIGQIPLTPEAATDRAAPRQKRGPRALAHHPRHGVLYVLNRLSNTVSVVDTAQAAVVGEIDLPDPTPVVIKEGRGFLYDAMLSGNGTASCASCHIDGRDDGLAWDLGDPGGVMRYVTAQNGRTEEVHPMKGPMLTQTLQGLDVASVLHWRGEMRGFGAFNDSFDSLLGGARLQTGDMWAFEQFVDTFRREANPHRNLDGSMPGRLAGGNPRNGETLFHTGVGVRYYFSAPSCSSCHQTADGVSPRPIDRATMRLPQPFRAAPLSDVHRRIRRADPTTGQVTRGFGLSFDGRHDDVAAHLSTPGFFALRADQKADLQAFLIAFDTGTAPSVGHSITLDAAHVDDPDVTQQRTVLLGRGTAGDCDVVLRGTIDDRSAHLLWDGAGSQFVHDRSGESPVDVAGLLTLVRSGRAQLTMMGVPPGEGRRYALDRDGDGTLDGDVGRAEDYGVATGATPPRLRLNGASRLGNEDLAVVADRVPASQQTVLWLSNARVDLDLGGLRLLVDPGFLFGFSSVADARGTALWAMPLPGDASLDGVRLMLQAVALDGRELVASRGLELTLRH